MRMTVEIANATVSIQGNIEAKKHERFLPWCRLDLASKISESEEPSFRDSVSFVSTGIYSLSVGLVE